MSEILRPDRREVIVYDPDLIDQISSDRFRAENWPLKRQLGAGAGGRGSTFFVGADELSFALRHYYRGGLPGRFFRDQYCYSSEEASRSFREYRLLTELVAMELPVPKPVAARQVRRGLIYRADLLTQIIPDVQSLAEALRYDADIDWASVGKTIRRFHEHNVYHADLNAHNIQLNSDSVWLLDFDRGAIRPHGNWKRTTLNRLLRSMRKITRGYSSSGQLDAYWQRLTDAYGS